MNLDRKQYPSYSSLRMFDYCNRYYYYHYELGLPTEPSFAAEYSRLMIHQPIASLYKDQDQTISSFMAEQWDQLQQLRLENPYPRILTARHAADMVDLYWEKYGQHDLAHFNIIHCEDFLYDDENQFQSVPDVVLQYNPGSEEDLPTTITVLDHKVSAYTPKPVLSSFNTQLLGQVSTLGLSRWPLGQVNFVADLDVLIGINAFDLNRVDVDRQTQPINWAQFNQYCIERMIKRGQIAQCKASTIWPRNAPDACVKFSGKTKIKCEFWNQCEKG